MAPDLLEHLRSDPILKPSLVGVDATETAIGRFHVDAFYHVPWGNADDYVDVILDIVNREQIDVVLPGSDQEAIILSSNRELFAAAGAIIVASPPSVLALINDKYRTYETLISSGINVPTHKRVSDVTSLMQGLAAFDYPDQSVIVKPVAGRGGRGLRLLIGNGKEPPSWVGAGARESRLLQLPHQEELHSWFAGAALMIMPMLDAPAYDIDIFAVNGLVKHVLVRQRINPAGIPFTGNRLVTDIETRDYAIAVAQAVGLNGLHDIDLMTDSLGRPALLEVNPRMSGSVSASHAAGFPVVAAAIAELLGISYPMLSPTKDIEIGLISRGVLLHKSYE
jgi:carbamoylphosphate synthase large subunit